MLFPRYKNQTVAVKIVNKGETPEEIAKKEARFAREVAMISKVQHKNLVKVCLIGNFAIYFKHSKHRKSSTFPLRLAILVMLWHKGSRLIVNH